MHYWMMRLFLVSREHPPLLEKMKDGRKIETRGGFLRRKFGTDIRFPHLGTMFVFKHFFPLNDHFIAAVIGRERTATIHLPPERAFQEQAVPDWETANVFIDISGDAEGQKVAMHRIRAIGKPLPVFRSLADHINQTDVDSDWTIAVNAITSKQSFWEAAKKYQGRIAEVDMTFIPPNIWKGTTETDKALRELHKENNADEVEVRLKNKDQKLNPAGSRVQESVEYITKGGGSLKIKGLS